MLLQFFSQLIGRCKAILEDDKHLDALPFNSVPVDLIAVGVAQDSAHRARPWVADNQESAFTCFDWMTISIDDICINCRQGTASAAWFKRKNRRCTDHDSTRFSLPPGIHNR